jgi:MtrB/PioB family decaheme-associated outer membrane protein
MKAIATVRVAGAALLLLSWTGVAKAADANDLMLGGFRLSGEVEAGVMEYIDRPSPTRRGKFEEYRDMTPGMFLDHLRLSLQKPDGTYGMELYGTKWGYDDQRYEFSVGGLGRWELNLEWDQIPHVYSTTARWLATEQGRGVFVLPSVRPPLNAHNSAPSLDEISMRTDRGLIGLKLTPSPDVTLTTSYQVIRRDGDRDFSMAFGSPGNNFYGILEPIDQTIHDFRIGVAIARPQWQAQFGYGFSYFANANRWVRADNPCFPGAPAGCSANDFAAGSPITGQTSLPPDNMAHTFTAGAGVNLPLRTRINGAFTYSLFLQNTEFLPHTINAAITSPDLVLPQRSLHGDVQNFIVNLTGTSRPFTSLPLTLTAKYRLHDFLDVSDQITFPGHVVNDKSLVTDARRAGRWSWMRQDAELDGRYQIVEPVALTLGAGWERYDRNAHREVPVSDEFTGKAALDVTPFDWLLARLTYRASFRRIDEYNSRAHAEHAVLEDPAAALQGQSVLLRKFDEAERNRQRVDLMLQFTPRDTVSISPTFGYRWDDYIDSRLGLQNEQAWNAGIDFSWTPIERVILNAGYSHERTTSTMRSRSRPVTGTTTFDFPDFDWVSNLADTIDSITLGIRAALIPSKLDWIANASYQYALGRVETNNPVAPASGTAAQRNSARAQQWPAFEDQFARLETALRYHISRSWTASLSYAFEAFQKHDWRTDTLNPFMGPDAVWMGNDSRNYTAHIIGATLTYRFGR